MLPEIISRTRRNHGLEHATIHVLSEKHKHFSAQGNSTPQGFFLNIYGDIPEKDVVAAVEEAYTRMKNGEHELAVHPNCGTVLLTTATMGALAAQASFSLEQRRQKQSQMTPTVLFGALPMAVLAVAVSLIAARPFGMYVQQKFTTDGDLGNLQIRSIRRISPSPVTRIFQLLLGQAKNDKVTAYKIDTIG